MSNKQIPEGAQFTADGCYCKIEGVGFMYNSRYGWHFAKDSVTSLFSDCEITWLDGVDAGAVKRKYIADAASVIGVRL